ncbi:MAG: hypothetical protein P1P76_12560, partial [Anaerolineales bacterium]|nr:hypothetical protein [Anaerolineales bacterium]
RALDLAQVLLHAVLVLGSCQPRHPLCGGGELHPMADQTRLETEGDGQMGLFRLRQASYASRMLCLYWVENCRRSAFAITFGSGTSAS